jgi:hypothetical protein
MSIFTLAGKTAMVTGGSRGIGLNSREFKTSVLGGVKAWIAFGAC